MLNEIIIYDKHALHNLYYLTYIYNRIGSTKWPSERQWQVPVQNKFKKSSNINV